MLFQALNGPNTFPKVIKFKCIYLRTTYSIVLMIVACVGLYKVHVTVAVSFEASLNAFC